MVINSNLSFFLFFNSSFRFANDEDDRNDDRTEKKSQERNCTSITTSYYSTSSEAAENAQQVSVNEIDTQRKNDYNLTSGINVGDKEGGSVKIGVLGVESSASLPSRIPVKKESTNVNTELSPISKSTYGTPDSTSSSKEMHKPSRNSPSPSGIPVPIIHQNVIHSPQKMSAFGMEMAMNPSIESTMTSVNELPHSPNGNNQNIESNTVDCMNAVPQRRNIKRSSLMNATEMAGNITTPIPKRRVSMIESVSKSDKVVSSSLSKVVKVAIRVRPFSQIELQNEARRVVSHDGDKLVIVNPTAFDTDPDTIALAAGTLRT